MASKTANAARKAVERGEASRKQEKVMTREEMIYETRNLRDGKLHVPMHYVDELLAAYDELFADYTRLFLQRTEGAEQ